MSSDPPGPLAFDETLEEIAGTLWGVTERIGATDLAVETSTSLRAFAGELRETAKRYSSPIGGLRRYGRRALYALEDDELDDEDEVYAIVEVRYADADDRHVSALRTTGRRPPQGAGDRSRWPAGQRLPCRADHRR